MQEIISYFAQMPLVEWAAVILSLAYVILAANNNSWCWPAAFASTLMYAVIFYDVQLLMDSMLQVYYLVMAVYGWYCWHNNSLQIEDDISHQERTIPITTYGMRFHGLAVAVLTVVALALGYLMDNYTRADFAYLDSLTTVFAVFATYLIAKKALENWLYFIVIDLVSIYLYIEKALLPTAFLFVLYVIIATAGFFRWRAIYLEETSLGAKSVATG